MTAALLAAPPGVARASDPVVRTEQGFVRGLGAQAVEKFLGIRYAAPPTGARRWAPPMPPARWQGVRDARAYGNRCPQLASGNGPRSESEDCLYLNVYRPADVREGARLPVLFWIYGGGLRFGASEQHDGSLLASANRIVVVSINYRLGVFGFLGLPSLSAESPDYSSGDYGLLDQQAALRWVNRNIAAFGGDPRHVTIAGESAGGWSVCANLASPAARGLFAGAIMQSGSCASRPLSETESASATTVAEPTGCTDPATAAACLRSRPVSALLDAGAAFMPRITSGGRELPAAPADAVAAGDLPRVPVLFGSNRDEGRFFAQQQGFATFDEQQYEELVTFLFGADAPAVLAEYPFAAYPAPYAAGYAIGAVITDGLADSGGGCPARDLAATLARRTPTWVYEFADRNAPGLNDDLPGFDWGAAHTLELAYMWPSFHHGIPLYPQLTPAQRQLSDAMVRYWGTFVRFGAPAAPGQPPWPSQRTGKLLSLRPGRETAAISVGEYAAEHNCGFWSSLGR